MSKIHLTYCDLLTRARKLPIRGRMFGIPNGGTYAALLTRSGNVPVELTEDPESADCFIDDIIDSGKTRDEWTKKYNKPFHALVDKTGADRHLGWVVFPWERVAREDGPQDAVRRLLQYIGEDPDREGLKETPDRVVRSYGELFSGYRQNPEGVLKTFEDGACDEMVLLKGVEIASTCEHHMLPFVGVAHVAYIPSGKIVGLSKLARLVEVFARRLQVQERLTVQVTQALDEHLKPRGSACVIEAKHLCMACRGVQKQHSIMITSSLTGVFRQPEVRHEFFNLIRG